MALSNGSAEPDTASVAWHDEQLQRVRAVFDSVDSAAADVDLRAKVVAQLPDDHGGAILGTRLFRDLIRVEHRPSRFLRLLRIWSGKVAAEVWAGDYEAAGRWMRVLTGAPVFPEEFAQLVAEAKRDLSRDSLFEELVTGLVSADTPDSADLLLASWGEPLVEYLVSQITVEEPIVTRRSIVDLLGMAGRGDVRHLTARLADPRWFVVRSVVTAIGKAGRVSALPALEAVAKYDDDRVRVEVLRAIGALTPDEASSGALDALADPSPKVRQAAISLLRASAADSVVTGIVEVLEAGTGSSKDGIRLVEIIAERRGPQVREALERLTVRKLSGGVSRSVRTAAGDALAGWSA
jgi:hypothetical protein